MAAYETNEADNQDHDTMKTQNTQAAERVMYFSITLILRNVPNLKIPSEMEVAPHYNC